MTDSNLNTVANPSSEAAAKFIEAFVINYSDSRFTNPHEVVLPDEPKECGPEDFTHMGKQYYGWEGGRHAATSLIDGEDALEYDVDSTNWMNIALKERAEVSKISISTKYFTGNQVQAVSVFLIDEMTGEKTKVLDEVTLDPDAEHEFDIDPILATECRVECFYEGGISRVNFFGNTEVEQMPSPTNLLENAEVSHVSNEHYGKPHDTVVADREVMHMAGWESARTGYGEQALFHLAEAAEIDEIVVDTYMHRLNPPLSCHIFGVNLADGENIDDLMNQAPRYKLIFDGGKEVIPDDFAEYMTEKRFRDEEGVENNRKFKIAVDAPEDGPWKPIVPFGKLAADTFHRFKDIDSSPVTHILYMHYPNGGIHALRAFPKGDIER